MQHSMSEQIVFAPLGEQALIVSFGASFHPQTHRRIVRLANALAEVPFPGFQECVPSQTTLCVYFDAGEIARADDAAPTPYERACGRVRRRIEEIEERERETAPRAKTVRVPVCYCSRCGPDLPELASRGGMGISEAVRLHGSQPYLVAMIGFLPGFPYLRGLPEKLSAPRLDTPRVSVPAGSVAIANELSGIYPQRSPGGWRLIGRTPIRLFRPELSAPSFLEIGDAVSFVPISHEELERGAAANGVDR